ncbi:threonine ammonia-lyase, biosynthetic [Methylophilus sp. VKM B-3414]|uniref:threonine ammonia-lyase, biosynthetic n=1 Tax=Methylophilus sp. VKM B-3414 TaxID=3076121 RepID=UPI0028C9DF5D|nr:threonine ammonia-lyase, biosynthetic [Methylophilus sp. VKM B-3414]MDT7849242.1 threonine ammonia-lyase, biosynthetic [Methylophilus sp. VKM B-3414]
MTINYREKIEHSQVYAVARHTPLDELPNLSSRLNNRVLLKREDMQPVFSFKLRGAYNKMANLSAEALQRGVICASAGNHAQGVALSAQKMGCRAVIVMPTTTPAIKVNAVRARGAEVVLFGDSYSDAYLHALDLEQREGLTFVHPYDDPDVIAGQGTIALELVQDHAAPIEAVFCCVGGGGLLAGMAAYLKAVRPEIKVIGVEAQDAEAMTESLKLGQRVMLEQVGLFADGAAVKQVGEHTFALVQQYVDEMIVVDNDAICAAIKDVFEDTRSILEPAGALAVAGLKAYSQRAQCQGKTLVAVASGANMNFDRLRFIAERAELGERREAVFAVTIPETPGAFKRFCRLLGQRNITEFNYRFADTEQAHIFVGLAVHHPTEADVIASKLAAAGLPTINLSDNEMAKLHLRHLVGGHAPQVQNEVVYRFEFPEKPGALMNFLESMGHNWNISLFHYRNHGADFGRVLVGMQVPPEDQLAFTQFLQQLGYPYWDESHNPAYRLFLG